MRQSEGNRMENRLDETTLTALFIASRNCVVRWGTRWARSNTLLLKTTLLKKIRRRLCSSQSIALLLPGSNEMRKEAAAGMIRSLCTTKGRSGKCLRCLYGSSICNKPRGCANLPLDFMRA